MSSTLREDGRVAQITSRIKAELLGVSVVTVAELKRGALAADFGERRTREIEDHLRRYIALPIDRDIAEEWARLRLRCDRLGRSKNENDLWIAATAKRHGLRLATLDRDHYDIPGLAVIQHDGTEVTVPE